MQLNSQLLLVIQNLHLGVGGGERRLVYVILHEDARESVMTILKIWVLISVFHFSKRHTGNLIKKIKLYLVDIMKDLSTFIPSYLKIY